MYYCNTLYVEDCPILFLTAFFDRLMQIKSTILLMHFAEMFFFLYVKLSEEECVHKCPFIYPLYLRLCI